MEIINYNEVGSLVLYALVPRNLVQVALSCSQLNWTVLSCSVNLKVLQCSFSFSKIQYIPQNEKFPYMVGKRDMESIMANLITIDRAQFNNPLHFFSLNKTTKYLHSKLSFNSFKIFYCQLKSIDFLSALVHLLGKCIDSTCMNIPSQQCLWVCSSSRDQKEIHF